LQKHQQHRNHDGGERQQQQRSGTDHVFIESLKDVASQKERRCLRRGADQCPIPGVR